MFFFLSVVFRVVRALHTLDFRRVIYEKKKSCSDGRMFLTGSVMFYPHRRREYQGTTRALKVRCSLLST